MPKLRSIPSANTTPKHKVRCSVADHSSDPDSLPDKYDLARRFRVTARTVNRWTKARLIPSIQFGPKCVRYKWADVERAIRRLTVEEVQ